MARKKKTQEEKLEVLDLLGDDNAEIELRDEPEEISEEEVQEISEAELEIPKPAKRAPRPKKAPKPPVPTELPPPEEGLEIPNAILPVVEPAPPVQTEIAASVKNDLVNQMLVQPWEHARSAVQAVSERLESIAKNASDLSAATSKIQTSRASLATRIATAMSVVATVLSIVSLSLSQSVRTQVMMARPAVVATVKHEAPVASANPVAPPPVADPVPVAPKARLAAPAAVQVLGKAYSPSAVAKREKPGARKLRPRINKR